MTDETHDLIDTARQLVEAERTLGGSYMPAERNPLPQIEMSAAPAAAAVPQLSVEQKAASLGELAREVADCSRCALKDTRKNVVFGEVNPAAELVFVGEAPGADEDASGRPFVGRAGELLTKMIEAMGLTRQDVFICNILKCRPPNNRAPNPQEVQCCWDFLIRQLQIIRPKVIVTLGNPATQNLLNTKTGITRLRGTWQALPDIGEGLAGTPVMPTFHPAYILRQYSPENRKKVWSDLQQVMKLLGLTRPEK